MNINFDKAKIEAECKKYQVDFLGVFGSVARNEEQPESDIDLLVRFSPQAKVGYFRLYDVEKKFSDLFGKKVDLVTEEALSPYIKDRVLADLKILYGQP
jgi:uncharacterized protein